MIYRIKPDLGSESLKDYLDKASALGNLCYSKDSIFVETNKSYMEISVIFQNCEVEPIEPHYDLRSCSELVKNWCNTIWRNHKIKEFENSDKGQSRLNEIMTALDELDKQNKRGVANAKSKDERGTDQGESHSSAS